MRLLRNKDGSEFENTKESFPSIFGDKLQINQQMYSKVLDYLEVNFHLKDSPCHLLNKANKHKQLEHIFSTIRQLLL